MQDRHIVTPEAKLVGFLLLTVSLSQIRNTARCQKKSNNEVIFVFFNSYLSYFRLLVNYLRTINFCENFPEKIFKTSFQFSGELIFAKKPISNILRINFFTSFARRYFTYCHIHLSCIYFQSTACHMKTRPYLGNLYPIK